MSVPVLGLTPMAMNLSRDSYALFELRDRPQLPDDAGAG